MRGFETSHENRFRPGSFFPKPAQTNCVGKRRDQLGATKNCRGTQGERAGTGGAITAVETFAGHV